MINSPCLQHAERALLTLALAALLAACAASPPAPAPEELTVQRAQARWDALLADDVPTAYGYFTPAYRSGMSLTQFYRKLAALRIKWTGATVTESDCSENVCKVQIFIKYDAYGAVPGVPRFEAESSAEENWIFTDGDWFYLPD